MRSAEAGTKWILEVPLLRQILTSMQNFFLSFFLFPLAGALYFFFLMHEIT